MVVKQPKFTRVEEPTLLCNQVEFQPKALLWSRGVARWFRWSLSVADPFVCRCLTSRGPGRWPGQSGKELGSTERCLHSLVEQHATEVSRYSSGVFHNTDH